MVHRAPIFSISPARNDTAGVGRQHHDCADVVLRGNSQYWAPPYLPPTTTAVEPELQRAPMESPSCAISLV